MQIRDNKIFPLVTLFFFVTMVLSSPVLAQSQVFSATVSTSIDTDNFPVTYVTPQQAELIIWESQKRGYTVKQGSWKQLAELTENSQPATNTVNDETKDKQPCETIKSESDVATEQQQSKQQEKGDCIEPSQQPMPVELPNPPPATEPIPPQPVPPPPSPESQTQVHTNVGIYADVSYGSGRGSNSDVGKVFFIVAGIMVIAAFIVYAGKYISDLVSGKDHKVWWEFIFSNDFLSTDSREHGRLNGLKIATGFVSSDLIQVALVGEVGQADIDLVLSDYVNPVVLDFTATYWMLGATARMHLTDKLVNASYLYLDFMGGKTDHGSTDTIGIARLGASFGVNDYLRLGASIGAFYLGLDEDQGFANNGDNYWTTFGIEMGVKF